MKKKAACIFLLVLLIPAIGLVGAQYFDYFNVWNEIVHPLDEIKVVDDNNTLISQVSPQICADGEGCWVRHKGLHGAQHGATPP